MSQKGNLHLDENGVITLFGRVAFLEGGRWHMDTMGMGMAAVISEEPVAADIEQGIETDYAAGNGDRIHHVQVNVNAALCLFLEGRIKREHIERAEVAAEQVIFRGVKFKTPQGAKDYDVVVMRYWTSLFATMDENGKVIE